MVPSPRLLWIAAGGLFVAALPLVYPLAWIAVVAMWVGLGIALAVDLITLLRARAVLTPTIPEVAFVGARLEIPVAITLTAAAPLTATLRAELDAPLTPGPDATQRLAPGERQVVAMHLGAPRRGTGTLRALWLRLEGPLGVMRSIARVAVEDEVRIVPNAKRVRELASAYFGGQPSRGGSRVEHRPGDGGEFDAMVSYARGMDVRQIDWKSSARHQDLRVRRFRLERNQRLVVCVDTGRTMADPIARSGGEASGADGVAQRLDHAIHAAMVLSQTALRAGDLVGLHAYGASPEAWVPLGGGVRHASKIADACAGLSARPVETNHVLGLHALLTRLSRRSLVVVLTELSDATTAELMIEHLGHLARRHLVIFVALDDPVIDAPLASPPERAQDLAAAIIAGQLQHERQRVLRRLARLGVDVVHGPPGPATLKLLERYMHVKRRGLIG